jgi:hypothetical protein
MAKFVVYAHDKTDVESNLIYVCTCDTEAVANNIATSLNYRDTGGREDGSGFFNYYVKREDWIV